MRSVLLRLAALLLPLILVACGDLPTSSPAPDVTNAGPMLTCTKQPDGSYLCPPISSGEGGDDCDPYHFDCGADDCIASAAPGNPEEATVQGCYGGGGGGDGTGGGGDDSGGGGGGSGGTAPGPGVPCPDYGCPPPEGECDPNIHPDCEKPLTAMDTATINAALRNFLRPANAFTDSVARKHCAQMELWFRRALQEGDVFRGAFDSNATNDPYGSHYGMYAASGNIHFDPFMLDAANAGSADARRELAVTALHEAAHRAGYRHPTAPTFDAQGRDYYTDFPFHYLNPGPNSCVPR